MSLRELKKEPPHWRALVSEMRRLFEVERQTVVRRKADIENLAKGLDALHVVLAGATSPPSVSDAPSCPGEDPRCSCARCRWRRIKSNLARLCKTVPGLVTPSPSAADCVDCGGVVPLRQRPLARLARCV